MRHLRRRKANGGAGGSKAHHKRNDADFMADDSKLLTDLSTSKKAKYVSDETFEGGEKPMVEQVEAKPTIHLPNFLSHLWKCFVWEWF